jgi:hypothetical protein
VRRQKTDDRGSEHFGLWFAVTEFLRLYRCSATVRNEAES